MADAPPPAYESAASQPPPHQQQMQVQTVVQQPEAAAEVGAVTLTLREIQSRTAMPAALAEYVSTETWNDVQNQILVAYGDGKNDVAFMTELMCCLVSGGLLCPVFFCHPAVVAWHEKAGLSAAVERLNAQYFKNGLRMGRHNNTWVFTFHVQYIAGIAERLQAGYATVINQPPSQAVQITGAQNANVFTIG